MLQLSPKTWFLSTHLDVSPLKPKTQHPVESEAWTVGHVGPTYKFIQGRAQRWHDSGAGAERLWSWP